MASSDALPTLSLKAGRKARSLDGHPWVFAGEVESMPPASLDGQVAVCRDHRGRLLGSGVVNTRSQILWRRFSRRAEALQADKLRQLLENALNRRAGATVARLVWSECDDLPGLTVDRLGEVLVVQVLSLAMELRRDEVAAHLLRRTSARVIVWRDDAPVRAKEGLEVRPPSATGVLEPFWLDIDGVEFHIDPLAGQKTGFYLDQRGQYQRVAAHARGRKVLDCFCNQGGFALHAMKAGALSATAVDSSTEAVRSGRSASIRNGMKVDFIQANVFDHLKTIPAGPYDLIVLDPPPFAPGKDRVVGALRGYKEINLRALKILPPGGILATYACSHHIAHELFQHMLAEAARDAGRTLRLLEIARQPADHPIMLHYPESEYLRGFIVEVGE
jgi:23S rRNA (cytosine1962-C5)-methyltransferase